MLQKVRPQDVYRLPWTLTDNVLSWLEPTKRCNLYCEGCYSRNDPTSDKTLAQVRSDMEVFTKHRNVDSISIAGGDPLVYPHIVDVVKMIRQEYGLKAIVNTNGLALTEQLLKQLVDADLSGFTFHIDSGQVRPGHKKKTEIELNDLRLHYARMVRSAGDLSVAFNATIYPHTKHYIPELVKWAQEHIDLVSSMVFILYRTTREDQFDYYCNGRKVDTEQLVYHDADKNPTPVIAQDAIDEIRKADPLYQPCGYLGGTVDPDSFKWLIATRFGTKEQIYGYMGNRGMEAVQVGHHVATGRYLGYSRPSTLNKGRAAALGLAAIDSGARKAAAAMVKASLRSPKKATEAVYTQSLLIIQPIDNLADGRANMCDGCPDMTVYDGKLVWSCRLDECQKYGTFLQAVPKNAPPPLVQLHAKDEASAQPS
jgi:organic radical activating enzyme